MSSIRRAQQLVVSDFPTIYQSFCKWPGFLDLVVQGGCWGLLVAVYCCYPFYNPFRLACR